MKRQLTLPCCVRRVARMPDGIWSPLMAGGLVLLAGLLSLLLLQPWLFPSLGPTAFIQAHRPKSNVARFYNLCAMCHGAPGVEPTEIGKGLYPPAPELSKVTGDMSVAEIYWIISNGIKDTGMPAFEASLPENDRWLIASFVKRLAGMSAKDYQSLSPAGG